MKSKKRKNNIIRNDQSTDRTPKHFIIGFPIEGNAGTPKAIIGKIIIPKDIDDSMKSVN